MSYWYAGATIVSAAYTAYASNKASKDATKAQTNAAQQGINAQQSQFDKQTALQSPWRTPGANSMGYLSYLMGVPGSEQWKPGYFDATQTPATPGAPGQGAPGSSVFGRLIGAGMPSTSTKGSSLWSPTGYGGVLGGGGFGGGDFGSALGFSAQPQGGSSAPATSSTSPLMSMHQKKPGDSPLDRSRPTLGGNGGLPMFSSPEDPAFQQLPSGAHFIGPDGVERMKH